MNQFNMEWRNCLIDPDGAKIATFACIPVLLKEVVYALLAFAGMVALFFILYAGLKMIAGAGDPKQADGARKTLTFAVIGLVVVLASFFIINAVAYITGAKCIAAFGAVGPDNCGTGQPIFTSPQQP